jgi:hypothetical protein
MHIEDSRIETIENVPREEMERVADDFRKAGASVETLLRSDGTFTIIARFTSESRYPASGVSSLMQ